MQAMHLTCDEEQALLAREQREFLLAQYYPYYAAEFGRCHALGCPMYLAVVDEAYELFLDLDATDEQIDFPIVYTSAKAGRASRERPADDGHAGFF